MVESQPKTDDTVSLSSSTTAATKADFKMIF